ncbi:serine/threonine-protein kinase [Lysobacter enzymogenes]|uniref:serine/threonine-protein kinase n=1 Tax=Lysobacter enzymogenes TaxID=69 RepID=UPI001A96E356|nr:serine/threonine-protein kinase [Lysobacter enzymogenes]QQP97696.1 serine/threonine protein kinase [Lysobacter enzymogenes]
MNASSARALHLFDEFVELPAAERERRLAALAVAEPDTHAALCALLQADDDDGGVLDRAPAQILSERRQRDAAAPAPAAADAGHDADPAGDGSADLRIGARLGAWRIDRIVGRGGMGTVYEAHRDDGEYQQRVALKCIRAELDSPQSLAALREERNLLARLDHSGIAALVDGGGDSDGRPWFALRYVEGEPIDAWCDRHGLDVAARVDLLLQVCDAVAYAHAQGVLHRDLKPSNVLVTADGRAQLLDFGMSARIGPWREAQSELAAPTPHYAAPEAQLRGAQGPATDLYALGVLTYRLLCGRWPTPLHGLRPLLHGSDSGAALPMAQLAEDADDASARARGAADPAALARRLRGDLSAVALKAVAARAQDRYPSVAEYADELRRWRQGRPVRVRPGTWLSRTRKWLRRNRAATALSATVLAAALAGAGTLWWQHRQVLGQAEAGAQVGRLFASTLGAATLSGLGSARFSSRALLESTERELRALPLSDQPGVRAHALATLARGYAKIGDYRHAAALAAQAQDLADDDAGSDEDGFVAATRLETFNYTGRYREALALADERLRRLDGGDAATTQARIAIGGERARALWGAGQTRQALASADELLALARALAPARDELVAYALILRSGFLRGLGRLPQAEADAQSALALARPLDALLADDALERLVDVQRVRVSPAFAASARALLEERRRHLGPDHPQTALAEAYYALSRFPYVPRAEAERILARIETGYGREHPVYALALSRLAWTAARDRQDELRMQREAVRLLQRSGSDGEMLLNARTNLARVLLGSNHETALDYGQALELLRLNIAERHRLGLPSASDEFTLALTLSIEGGDSRLALARRTIDDALRKAPDYYAPGDAVKLDLLMFGAIVRYREGLRAQADSEFARLLDAIDAAPVASGNAQGRIDDARMVALAYRSAYAFQTCRDADASRFMERAMQVAQTGPRLRFKLETADLARDLRQGWLPARAPYVARTEGDYRYRPAPRRDGELRRGCARDGGAAANIGR